MLSVMHTALILRRKADGKSTFFKAGGGGGAELQARKSTVGLDRSRPSLQAHPTTMLTHDPFETNAPSYPALQPPPQQQMSPAQIMARAVQILESQFSGAQYSPQGFLKQRLVLCLQGPLGLDNKQFEYLLEALVSQGRLYTTDGMKYQIRG